MKWNLSLVMALLVITVQVTCAQDVREAARKAEMERQKAIEQARQIEERILADRTSLLAEVEKLEASQNDLQAQLTALESKIEQDEETLARLEEQWSQSELDFQEISGNVRVAARDLETMIRQSPFSARFPARIERIEPLLRKGYFPDIDDIAGMADLYFDEIARSGQVGRYRGDFIGRDGEDTKGQIVTLGKFTAIYRDDEEVGFLNYSPESQRFFALSNLPSGRIQRTLQKYLQGDGEAVTIDLSFGAALRQITHKPSLADQLRSGGPIVWPILLIAVLALGIVVYKAVVLRKIHGNTDRIMGEVNRLAEDGDWQECADLVGRYKGKGMPVIHVLEAGLAARKEDRETLESILQEAILRELPRVESGLAILAIFGAVAPLLGLLGTVTGMIDTFRVITLFGTGDPKLMSGGISEALVTTMIGLAVAIPIMLVHTFLSRRVDHIIGDMEEKAITLANTIQKEKSRNGRHVVASA